MSLVIESVALVSLRVVSYVGCRRWLLGRIYSDLQNVANESTDETGEDIDLQTLPTPASSSTATPKMRGRSNGDGAKPQSQPLKSSLHSSVSRAVFAISFSESCMLFTLLICQSLAVFSPVTRLYHWRISLAALQLGILVIIPICIALLPSIRSANAHSRLSTSRSGILPRLFLSLAVVVLYLYALSRIPMPVTVTAEAGVQMRYLTRLVVLGTIILGVLSGYGCVSGVWEIVKWRRQEPVPTSGDIETAEAALRRIQSDLKSRKDEQALKAAAQAGASSSWFRMPKFGGDDTSQEIAGLSALVSQMSQDLTTKRERRENALFELTLTGRIYKACVAAFGGYCLLRIITGIINVFIGPAADDDKTRSYADIISKILAYFISILAPSVREHGVELAKLNVDLIARQVSLGLAGLIIISSVRGVLRGVAKLLNVSSRNLGASLMLLVLAQIMGIYLLSTLVQLRSAVPRSSKPGDDMDLFSTLPAVQVFGPLFNWAFLIAVGAVVVGRWAEERVNGS